MNGGKHFKRLHRAISDLVGVNRPISYCVLVSALAVLVAAFWFFRSAPPDTIVFTAGPKGSIFETNAEKYAKILARSGVKLKILSSEGSTDNLKRLADPKFKVDAGFVQGGIANGVNIDNLVSLGSVSYAPLLVFYKWEASLDMLSELEGRRIAIGQPGSGTRVLALNLLAANGIKPGGDTTLLDLDTDDAVKALLNGDADAVFMMGESASVQTMRKLFLTPDIRLMDFSQADAYARKFHYLNKLDLPKGAVDFGMDIPGHDISLVAPMVELVVRKKLHPALQDLLIEAAQEVHGKANILQQAGQFPTPIEHEFPISTEARRFYKSGKTFLYSRLPFRFASIATRILAVVVPLIVLLLPGMKIIPAAYQWRIKMRIYHWYRELLTLEKDMLAQPSAEDRGKLMERLDHIGKEVNKMKLPASFGDQFYVLLEHVDFVRERLREGMKEGG